jgi:hypothetical protein
MKRTGYLIMFYIISSTYDLWYLNHLFPGNLGSLTESGQTYKLVGDSTLTVPVME